MVESSTSAYVFNPEAAWEDVSRLGKENEFSGKKLGIEIYPFDRKITAVMQALAKRVNVTLPIPRSLTSQDLEKWQNDYNVGVSRVHLPYSYDLTEAILRPIIEGGRGLSQRIYLLAYLFSFGPATNNYALNIARELHLKASEKIEGTFHANVAQGFVNAGRIPEIQEYMNVLVEPSVPFRSRILRGDALSVPERTAREVVINNRLGGLVLNADHLSEEEVGEGAASSLSVALASDDVLNTTRVVHVGIGDETSIEMIKKSNFQFPVKVVVEGTPYDRKKGNYYERLRETMRLVLD